LTANELEAHATRLEDWLSRLIPGRGEKYASDEAAGIGTEAPPGYMWVDRNLLGDLAKPAGRLEDVIGERATSINDAINNASKTAIVYAKPGHFATRFVTNATLNILHGAANPLGIGRSVRVWAKLSEEEQLQVAALGGQGYVHAVFDPQEAEGRLGRLAGTAAGKGALLWAHVDTPFRVNAVLYELRRAGFTSAEDVTWLLANLDPRQPREHPVRPALHPQVVARVLWFYPWVKGSTIYAGPVHHRTPFEGCGGREPRHRRPAALRPRPGSQLRRRAEACWRHECDAADHEPAQPVAVRDAGRGRKRRARPAGRQCRHAGRGDRRHVHAGSVDGGGDRGEARPRSATPSRTRA